MSTHTGMGTGAATAGRTKGSSGGDSGHDGRGSRGGRSGGRLGGGGTTSPGRLRALARAELTLLIRTKSVIVTAVLVPLALPFSIRPALDEVDLKAQGLTIGPVLLTSAIGFSFLFAVYTSLVTVFAARREELVLKRLRTGELKDAEILAGTALPALCTGLAQSVLVAVGCTVLLDLPAPPPRTWPYWGCSRAWCSPRHWPH